MMLMLAWQARGRSRSNRHSPRVKGFLRVQEFPSSSVKCGWRVKSWKSVTQRSPLGVFERRATHSANANVSRSQMAGTDDPAEAQLLLRILDTPRESPVVPTMMKKFLIVLAFAVAVSARASAFAPGSMVRSAAGEVESTVSSRGRFAQSK